MTSILINIMTFIRSICRCIDIILQMIKELDWLNYLLLRHPTEYVQSDTWVRNL